MGLVFDRTPPEIKLARRLFKREGLSIPFNLEALVKKYATITYEPIPFEGVDGVCLHLKVPGKKPSIIVNSNQSEGRKRFTLAHELGHIIIPWHIGTIVDDLYSKHYKQFVYGQQEQEANSFAAELLMPKNWVVQVYTSENGVLDKTQQHIVTNAKVSEHAAAIAMVVGLPPNIIYAAVDDGHVIHSGKTAGTSAFPPEGGTYVDKSYYPYIKRYDLYHGNLYDYCWWDLNIGISTGVEDNRNWKDILDSIIADIKPSQGALKFKRSISGIIGSAKSMLGNQKVSVETLTSTILYRLRRGEYKDLMNHRDFETFVKKRAQEIFDRSN